MSLFTSTRRQLKIHSVISPGYLFNFFFFYIPKHYFFLSVKQNEKHILYR